MKTVNDFIKELQNLIPKYRDLPVVVQAENGMIFTAHVKYVYEEGMSPLCGDSPTKIIITYS